VSSHWPGVVSAAARAPETFRTTQTEKVLTAGLFGRMASFEVGLSARVILPTAAILPLAVLAMPESSGLPGLLESQTGAGFGSFLLGLANQTQYTVFDPGQKAFSNSYAAFFQDGLKFAFKNAPCKAQRMQWS
jgi:hypothetical protein